MLRFPPRRILAAVDPSEASAHAWRAAARIAARFGASLDAVYCSVPPPLEPAAGLVPEALDAARRATEEFLRRRLDPGARLHVFEGDPALVLPRAARERHCDLLVVGTHRRRGVARVILGSTAEAVVRDSPCPVLVVPGAMRDIRRVLAPIHDADYARKALLAAGFVARAYKARLAVLHVVTDPVFGPNPRELLSERISELPETVRRDTRPEAEVRRADPVLEILRAERGRDLVVLAAHRKSLLGDWILGTTAERVIRHSRIPVLTIPVGSRR